MLKIKGIPEGYSKIIQDMHEGVVMSMKTVYEATSEIPVGVGLHQGLL